MIKVRDNSPSTMLSGKSGARLNANQRLNANAGLTQEESDTLRDVADQLVSVSQRLATLIGAQVSDPTYVDGKNAAADRILDWTADAFALSEDIKFYLNPPPKE